MFDLSKNCEEGQHLLPAEIYWRIIEGDRKTAKKRSSTAIFRGHWLHEYLPGKIIAYSSFLLLFPYLLIWEPEHQDLVDSSNQGRWNALRSSFSSFDCSQQLLLQNYGEDGKQTQKAQKHACRTTGDKKKRSPRSFSFDQAKKKKNQTFEFPAFFKRVDN